MLTSILVFAVVMALIPVLNGIITSSPKNENSVIIYSPSSSSKPVWMSLFCWTQRKIFWRRFVTRLFWGTIEFHSRKNNAMLVNGAPELLCFPHSSEYLPLCSAEQRHSYKFGTTWEWVNDDRILIFGWTIPLTLTTFPYSDSSSADYSISFHCLTRATRDWPPLTKLLLRGL